MTATTTILKPAEFAAHIETLTDRVSVHRACNELLEQLKEKHKISTISNYLTPYRRALKKIENPRISEVISAKSGSVTQHIAVNLLKLNNIQSDDLAAQRTKTSNKSLGFDEDGNVREVDIPKIDIAAIVRKAHDLLSSNDYLDVSCAMLLLTGLRPNEQSLSKRHYETFEKVFDRDMVALEGNRIAFKGLCKKRNEEDIKSYFARPTLADSEVVTKHQKRFFTLSPWNQTTKEKSILRAIERRFAKLFADDLSTIADYDEKTGELKKANLYKTRAFYVCALRACLIAKGLGENQAGAYIQKAVGHDSAAETVKYLSKYEAHRFINPVDLDLDLNINEVGKMLVEIPEKIQETDKEKVQETAEDTVTEVVKETIENTLFLVDDFLAGINDSQKLKFVKILEETRNVTQAVLSLIESTQKTVENTTEKVVETKVEKTSVSDKIETIYQGITIYNQQQSKVEDCLFPSWGLVDKISKKVFNKTIAKVTFDGWESGRQNVIEKHLEGIGFAPSDCNALWNGKHHRKSIGGKIDDVVSIIKSSGNSD